MDKMKWKVILAIIASVLSIVKDIVIILIEAWKLLSKM